MRAGPVRVVAAVVSVLLVSAAAPVAAAQASPVPITTCGQVITTDAVLRTDLTCPGTALWVEANGVTVDLGNHRIISSDGAGIGVVLGVSPIEWEGQDCAPDVTLRGGVISGFFGGIGGVGHVCTGDVATGVVLLNDTYGLYLDDDFPLELTRSTIIGPNGIGGPNSAAEVGDFDVSDSLIEITDPHGLLLSQGISSGLGHIESSRLVNGSIREIEAGSVSITKSRLQQVEAYCDDTNITLTQSDVFGGGLGGQECGFVISGDRFVGPGSGTAIADASWRAEVTDSVFTGWGTAILWDGSPLPTLAGNTFRRNVTGFASIGSGLGCDSPSDICRGTITGNTFVDNSGPGLLLNAGNWTVGSNIAVRNGGLGIDAEPVGSSRLTITDLGGDMARGNQEPQCVGVVCATG